MKSLLLTISKRYPYARAVRHYYVVVRNSLLWLKQARLPIEQKTIVFQAYSGKFACSPKAIYENMLEDERFADFNFVWVVKNKANYTKLANMPRTSLVEFKSKAYYQAFATAKYWIVNVMIPLRIVKRPGQVMVQCWHGTPLKRLRNDIIEDTQNAMNARQDFVRKNRIDTPRYDYFISPSPFATEKFITAFGMEKLYEKGNILEIGYPRNDALLKITGQEITSLKKQFGLPLDKKVLLYAPTWRDDQHDSDLGYTHQNQLNFEKLQQQIGDEFVVLFRAHYMIANSFDFTKHLGFVFDVSTHDDINDLYVMSDALITDYSSVMFDYANLEKPILLYMYDREHYEKNLRGFYIDLAELPSEIIETQNRLTECIKNLDAFEQAHKDTYAAFCRKYVQLDDGHAADRLTEHLFDPPPLPVRPMLPLRRYKSLGKQGIK